MLRLLLASTLHAVENQGDPESEFEEPAQDQEGDACVEHAVIRVVVAIVVVIVVIAIGLDGAPDQAGADCDEDDP